MRAALNELAVVAPDWLQALAPPIWYERYSRRVENYRLPKDDQERIELAAAVGADGDQLLTAIDAAVEQPASEGDFFVPLSTESHGLDAAVAEEPVVLRKRKPRSEIPLGAVVACVAGCLVMVGLIVYQRTKGHAGAASPPPT